MTSHVSAQSDWRRTLSFTMAITSLFCNRADMFKGLTVFFQLHVIKEQVGVILFKGASCLGHWGFEPRTETP